MIELLIVNNDNEKSLHFYNVSDIQSVKDIGQYKLS